MPPIYAIILYGCLMVGSISSSTPPRVSPPARGADDEAVERRLTTQTVVRVQSGAHVNVLRAKG